MLANLQQAVNDFKQFWWKKHHQEVILFLAIVLISLLSFAAGFIAAKLQEQEPLQIIEPTTQTPGESMEDQLP